MDASAERGVAVDYDTEATQSSTSRRSTDLVRLYLQEIGRVPLLGRDEEVSLAQKVQRYMELVAQRQALAESLEREPTLEEWAERVQIEAYELRKLERSGKRSKE
ncbi:MAG: sigma-70 factor domain-containing protein, partial [Cyanobacteria bacterium J06648_11]